jgi:hypothetical protein
VVSTHQTVPQQMQPVKARVVPSAIQLCSRHGAGVVVEDMMRGAVVLRSVRTSIRVKPISVGGNMPVHWTGRTREKAPQYGLNRW